MQIQIPFVDWFSPSTIFEEAENRAAAVYAVALGRSENDNTTPDLKDLRPSPFLANDGTSISRHLVPEDFLQGGVSPVSVAVLGIATLASIASFPILYGIVGGAGASLGLLAIAALGWLFQGRWLRLQVQALVLGGEADAVEVGMAAREARAAQSEAASKDPSRFLLLGTSAGLLASAGDLFAIDRNLPVGLTQRDLQTHLFVAGATGTGKTSGIARPLVKQWFKTDAGALVLDGKGDLPREFAGEPGYQLVSPGAAILPLLRGLDPHEIAEALAALDGGEPDFWTLTGASMIYHSAVILKAASEIGEARWTLRSLVSVVGSAAKDSKSSLAKCQRAILNRKSVPVSGSVADSFAWWSRFASMPDKMAGSVQGTALGLIEPVLQHPELFRWAESENGVDMTAVLRGARIGIDVPDYKFGRAGRIVSSLARQQVYKAAKRRGSRWPEGDKQVLVIIDEAALAISRDLTSPASEAAILPVARSLGLSFVCMSQNVDQFLEKFGIDGGRAFLDQFRSFISFQSSAATLEYLRARAGKTMRIAREPGVVMNPLALVKDDAIRNSWIVRLVDFASALSGQAWKLIAGSKTASQSVLQADDVIPEDLPALHDGQALMVLSRANAPRRDVVKVGRVFN